MRTRMAFFDEKAREWDDDPQKIDRAKVFAAEILSFIKPDSSMKGFEYGCGTGLLSYFMKDHFAALTLADNSDGMLDVLRHKVKKEHIPKMTTIHLDLMTDDFGQHHYDVIYTLMTLHHITDIDKLIKRFSSMLKKGGYLCIGDLTKEDGSFHAHMPDFDGHNGFDRDELEKILANNGFRTEMYKVCYKITKQTGGKVTTYPLFLLIGKNNGDIILK
jgi:ubiquinone/menaquinone biosynthesis C-methylase UbiE